MATFTRDGVEVSSRPIRNAEPSFASKNYIFYLMLAAAPTIVLFAAGPHIAHAQHAAATPTSAAASSPRRLAAETPFLAENNQAMDKMMAAMNVAPTGDADFDFAAMMIPHHQGAVDMALAELRYGKNEKLRRIAQEIVVDQQQEIVAMRLAVGLPLPPSVPAPTQVSAAPRASMPPMTVQMNGK
jgi:hypothetical protein